MNKKITPKVIWMIALQSVLVMIAVTVVGGAVITHDKYKNTGHTEKTTTEAVSENQTTEISTTPTSVASTSAIPDDTSTTYNSDEYPYGYAGFFPEVTDTNVDISRLIISNSYSLPENYKPTLAEAVKGSGYYLDYRVAPYYQKMYDAAKADGIILTPVSGYRSFERQKKNLEEEISKNIETGLDRKEATIKATTKILIPGSSEHNAGLAMDICSLSQSFENTKEFDWLSENAAEYGFILRYPKSEKAREITKVTYEPWHYRFVGIDAAKEIKARGITFEEYLELA